jgi:hypothetical protein
MQASLLACIFLYFYRKPRVTPQRPWRPLLVWQTQSIMLIITIMFRLPDQPNTESSYLSFRDRLWVSAACALFAFLVLIYTILRSIPILPRNSLGLWLFYGSIVLGFLLPLPRFPNRYYGVFVPLGILIAWFAALYFIMPPIIRQEYIAKAQQAIPINAVLTPSKTTYSSDNFFVSGPGVMYSYKSKNPQKDYVKIHDFYRDYLVQRGWRVNTDNYINRTYISLVKDGGDAWGVNISLENDSTYPIRIGVAFN